LRLTASISTVEKIAEELTSQQLNRA
jgi:hypothetical protein